MNLSYLSFYSQYLNSPVTDFHKININYKISFIFLILIIIPYVNNLNLIYNIILFIYLFVFITYKSSNNLFLIEKRSLFLLTLIYSIFSYQKLLDYQFYQNYYIPYKIKKVSFYSNTYIFNQIIMSFICYSIPMFIIKTFIIQIIYLEIITILFISTKYESIVLFFLKYLQNIHLLKYKQKNLFLIVISFTSQFLERIIYNLDNLYYSIQLKYNSFYQLNIIISQILNKYILNILNDTYNISTNLWNREIIIKHFYN